MLIASRLSTPFRFSSSCTTPALRKRRVPLFVNLGLLHLSDFFPRRNHYPTSELLIYQRVDPLWVVLVTLAYGLNAVASDLRQLSGPLENSIYRAVAADTSPLGVKDAIDLPPGNDNLQLASGQAE